MWDTEVVASVSPTLMEQDSTQAVSADTTAQPAPVKHLKRGDTREDGRIFWCYVPSCVGGQWWLTPEKFAAKEAVKKAERAKKKAELSAKKDAMPTKLRCGNVREDGKVFWQYGPTYLNGEYWLSPEEFATKKATGNTKRRERRATNSTYAVECRLRCRVSSTLKRKGFKKNSKTATVLGCTYEEYRGHIERLFLPGMSWENRNLWHIDHLVPLDAAGSEEDVYTLNHHTNLRPMWGKENQSKYKKLPEEHELPPDLHPKVREIWKRAASSAPGTPNHPAPPACEP